MSKRHSSDPHEHHHPPPRNRFETDLNPSETPKNTSVEMFSTVRIAVSCLFLTTRHSNFGDACLGTGVRTKEEEVWSMGFEGGSDGPVFPSPGPQPAIKRTNAISDSRITHSPAPCPPASQVTSRRFRRPVEAPTESSAAQSGNPSALSGNRRRRRAIEKEPRSVSTSPGFRRSNSGG